MTRAITREIASYAISVRYEDLPSSVRQEAVRAFLNAVGCMLGGCREEAPLRAAALIAKNGPGSGATLIGYREQADLGGATFINSLSASALSFDDTHLATVTHPTGPVAAALLAYCETNEVSGTEFLNALALGIEIQCRLASTLLLPPAKPNLSLYITGITAPIGVAIALGRLMRLDEQRLTWAIGLAASQATGFRATHGSMAGVTVPAFGARNGVFAVQLAATGLDCCEDALESPRGLVGIFSEGADPGRVLDRIGTHFELMANTYKPYPAGIVIHAAIDACLDLAQKIPDGARIGSVELTVNPLTLTLTDRRHPATPFEAQISLHHWAASVLHRRVATPGALHPTELSDPVVMALRNQISAIGDATLARDEAIAEISLSDGSKLRSHVPMARGSIGRPMSDAELDAKFMMQSARVMAPSSAAAFLARLRGLADVESVWAQLQGYIDAIDAA